MEFWRKYCLCYGYFLQLAQSHLTLKIGIRVQYLCCKILSYFHENLKIFQLFLTTLIKKRLPPGLHQYKFIVDGEWRFSPEDSQTTDENGNINNIIDTTNYKNAEVQYLQESHGRPVAPIEHRERARKGTSFEDLEFDRFNIGTGPNYGKTPAYNNPMTQKNTMEMQGEKYGYSNINSRPTSLPEYSFKDKAPTCPPHLRDIYFLRQKEQKHLNVWKTRSINENMTPEEIEKQKRIEKNEILIHIFDSDRSLAPPQHVTTYNSMVEQYRDERSLTRVNENVTNRNFYESLHIDRISLRSFSLLLQLFIF